MSLKQLDQFFITDGLAAQKAIARYHQRRVSFLKECSCLTIFSGVMTPLSQNNHWLTIDTPIYQEPNMLYFTGLNQLNVALIFDPQSAKTILFLPPSDPSKVFWDGAVLGYEAASVDAYCSFFHYDNILCYDDLFDFITSTLQKNNDKRVKLFWHAAPDLGKYPPDCYDLFKVSMEQHLANNNVCAKMINSESIITQRIRLDHTDQANLSYANELTTAVFKTCCHELKQCRTENDVAAILKGEIYRKTPFGESFPAIIASGPNAAILHYRQHHSPLCKDGLLLLDFGCRFQSMPADISRTIPINGTFNPLQSLLYSIVLEAQAVVEQTLKEGLTITELNTICWQFIENALTNRFFNKGGRATRPYQQQPHNVSHLIAYAVHDGDRYRKYRTMPLQTGMVISNEPGIYGEFFLTIDGKDYHEHVGIRIEDNLLVTADGCLNLSQGCPKSIEDIEQLFT